MSRHVEGESLMGNGNVMFEGMPEPDMSRMTPEKQAEAKRISEQLRHEAAQAEAQSQEGVASIHQALKDFEEQEAA